MTIRLFPRRAACAVLLACTASLAAAWTDKPVRIIVPAPAGGVMDVLARVLGEQLSKDIGQTVVVDNKPGAGGGIGIQAMLAAPADGQTLMVTGSNVLTEVPHVLKTPFDPIKDVRPVAAVVRARNLLVTAPSVPAQDFAALVNFLKASPGKHSYASHSPGTNSHYAGMQLSQSAALDLQHIPFAGAPPALAQVMGGQVTMIFDSVIASPPLVASGKLRAYAVGGTTRHPNLPNVPTFTEVGRPDLDYSIWFGLIASTKLPDAQSERILKAVQKAAEAPAVKDKLVAMGFEMAAPQPLAALAQSVKAEHERNGALVKKFNITP